MTIYRYQSGSLLAQAEVFTNDIGGKRAYLYASDVASSEQLRQAKQALRDRDWKCVPTVQYGKPVLEVRGFEENKELLDALAELQLTRGIPEGKEDKQDISGKKASLSKRTLQLSGLSYNVGDAAYLYYKGGSFYKNWKTYHEPDRKTALFFDGLDVVAGIGYALGSYCLTFFGSKDQSINTIRATTEKIEKYARTQGYEVPPESSLAFTNTDPERGTWGNIKHIMQRYPSEVFNSIYVGVGMFLSAAAIYKATRGVDPKLSEEMRLKAQSERLSDKIDVGLGVVTAASAITGLAVQERKPIEGEPKRSGIGGFIDWIREKPLRATGYGYMIATGFHAVSTWKKWKENTEPKSYLIGRVIFIVTNVFSEFLLAASSKGHGVGVKPDISVDKSIIATAAELVLRQPESKREAIISQLAGYMASPQVMATKASDVEQSIREHVVSLSNNPWTKHFIVPTGDTHEKTLPPETSSATIEKQVPNNKAAVSQYIGKMQTDPAIERASVAHA